MERISFTTEQQLYTVEIYHNNYIEAKEWCYKHPSAGNFCMKFGCMPDNWETIVEFGFTCKEDQILFMFHWK